MLNFPISGHPLPPAFVRGLGLVKLACAAANEELGLLSAEKGRLIRQVAQEVVDGKLSAHFPVDVFQTGSGTSSNMNINEVARSAPNSPCTRTTMSISASHRTTSSRPRCT